MTPAEMRLIPSPTQFDHWQLYQRIMYEEMVARFGVAKYAQWADAEEREEKSRKNWIEHQVMHDRFIYRAYLSRFQS